MFQHLGTPSLLLYFTKRCHGYIWKMGYCQVVIKTVKRKTKTKKQKIHKNHGVVQYVMENFQENVNKKKLGVLDIAKDDILHKLQTDPSQILGFSIEELAKRVDLFRASGITFNDAISLSLVIPPCLHINNNNFKSVIKTMQKYGLPVEKIIYQSPYIGGFEHVQLERNLKLLNDLNLKSELLTLISKHPILLSYQLNRNSLSILENLHSGERRTITKYIEMSFDGPTVQNKVVNQLLMQREKGVKLSKDAENFFLNYDIDLNKVYQLCPDILMLSKETLEKSLDCVLSAPFYFDISDLEQLIMSYPDVFISFHQENIISQVQYLEKISTSKYRLYKLLSEHAEIFRDPDKFLQRVALFKRFRFKDADIGRLLSQKGAVNCFLDCDDYTDETLTELLKLYLKHTRRDLKPIQIIYSSPICLSTKALPIIKPRLKFLRYIEKVKDISVKLKTTKDNLTLQRIIRSDLNMFVKLCGSTLEEFEKFSQGL